MNKIVAMAPEQTRMGGGGAAIGCTDVYQDIKFRVFNLVLERLEVKEISAENASRALLLDEIAQAVATTAIGQGVALNSMERSQLIEDVYNEICGLGPLEPLLRDPTINDIAVNGPHRIYVEREGVLSQVPTRFRDTAHLMNIIQRIVSPIGRRVDEANPYVDARLPDGSRVNVIIPPVALDGPLVSIRKFKRTPFKPRSLLRRGSVSWEMLQYLARAVASRLNILISGGTGAGKTTLLNTLSGFIDPRERLVTIEDAAELQLVQPHVARLETRPASPDGAREITSRELLRNALRMRPDRIILGEVRGAEALDMLQAMSTGHDGSMATIHANGARDALNRLEMCLGMAGMTSEMRTVRRYIANSVHAIVHVQRMTGGHRRVVSIAEVAGLEADTYALNELFRFEESPPHSGEGSFETVARSSIFEHRLTQAPLPASVKELT